MSCFGVYVGNMYSSRSSHSIVVVHKQYSTLHKTLKDIIIMHTTLNKIINSTDF